MQRLIGQIVTQFQDFFKNLTPLKRVSTIGVFVIILITLVVVAAMMSGTDHSPLLRNVPPDKISLVMDQLRQKNIPFKLHEDGATILVPDALLHSAQMAIMTDLGTSNIGQIGLEMFEKQDFGTTSYAQRINYQRALQGELMRAINTITAVKHSKVILAIPPKKTFLEEQGKTSASVVLELHPGKTLTPDQVRGITNLVASSVEGLEPENVTVVDERGKILSRHYSADSSGSAELVEMKRKIEDDLEQRVESILAKVVGTGKVIARVNATLNPRVTTTVEEKVDPDATAVRSAQTEEELLDGARTNPAGIPGARSNLPGAEDAGQVGFKQNVRKELKTTNFDVPKTVRNIRESAGNIERVSVAVLVDHALRIETNDKGEKVETIGPRTVEELTKYETLVKNAIGFSTSRGDDVKIESIKFEKEDFDEAEKLLNNLSRRTLLYSLFKWTLLGLSLILFFFVIVRPFMRWVTDSYSDTVEDMLPKTIEELEELQGVDNVLPGMTGAMPVLEESLDPNKAESELLKERIMNIMEADQEKASGAFALWMSRRDL